MTDAQIFCQIQRELALIRGCMVEIVALMRKQAGEPEKDTKPRTGQPANEASHPRTL